MMIVKPRVAAHPRRWRRIAGLRPRHAAAVLAELSDLLEAGCPLARALAVLEEQAGQPPQRKLIQSLHASILEGNSLAGAMAALDGHFNQVDIAMVEAAELGGFLQRTLREMAEQSQRQVEMVQRVRASLAYPAVLLLTSVASVIFLLSFLVPRFSRIYEAAHASLPLPTRLLMELSRFLDQYGWICLIALVALGAALKLALRNETVASRWHALLLRLPVVGPLSQDWAVSQFTRTMALLLEGGLPVLRSLRLTGNVLGNRALRARVKHLALAVEQGQALGRHMRGDRVFPPALAELISVGEESGHLAPVLARLAAQSQRRFSLRLTTVLALVEPAIILLVGALIGLIVASMLLPVLLMSTIMG